MQQVRRPRCVTRLKTGWTPGVLKTQGIGNRTTDTNSHRCTLKYNDPQGDARTYDPTIKNDS